MVGCSSVCRQYDGDNCVTCTGKCFTSGFLYDELQPYGTWIDHGRYGYVWMPNAASYFVPYGTNGYWVQTSYGNTWVSNYNWGWAPFHYGRWFYDDFYGWSRVPDTTWGPAWVTWRSGGGYYGWAPLCRTGRKHERWILQQHSELLLEFCAVSICDVQTGISSLCAKTKGG
ncbi:MAG: hypothetical protein QM762_21770 [Chryseolinea sp.]